MSDVSSYFKTPKHAVVFALTQTDGQLRANMLGITPSHYVDRRLAEQWHLELYSYLSAGDFLADQNQAAVKLKEIALRMIS